MTIGGKQDIALMGAIAAAAVLLLAPFLFFDIAMASSDSGVYYRWAVQFDEVLRSGNPYPRWIPHVNGGGGEPAFLFYSPLFFYLVAAAKSLTGDIWSALKLVIGLTAVLGGWVGYHGMRWLGMQRNMACLAAILLCICPFLISTNYTVNNWPWYAAWPCAVYVLLTAARLPATSAVIHPGLALGTCLLVLSHVLSALMVLSAMSAAIVAWVAYQHLVKKQITVRQAMHLLLAWGIPVAIGIGMSAIYLYPAMGSMDLISPDGWFRNEFIDWRTGFLFQLDPSVTPRWPLFQYWIPGLTVLMLLVALVLFRPTGPEEKAGLFLLVLAATAAAILGSQLGYGLYAWETPISKVQLPYRFGFILSLVAPLALVMALHKNRARTPVRYAAFGLISVHAAVAFVLVFQVLGQNSRFDPSQVSSSSAGQLEYIPAGALEAANEYLGAENYSAYCRTKALHCGQPARNGDRFSLTVQSEHMRDILLPLYAFQSMRITVNDHPIPMAIDPQTGLLAVTVAPGKTTIRVSHGRLPVEIQAFAISLVAFTLWLAAFLYRHEGWLIKISIAMAGLLFPSVRAGSASTRDIALQFIKFLMVGGMATVLHYVVLYIATGLYGMDAVIGSGIGAMTGAVLGFTFNFHYTFESRKSYLETSLRYLLVFGIGLIINLMLMFMLTKVVDMYYFYAQILTTLMVLIWNFSANRKWTF